MWRLKIVLLACLFPQILCSESTEECGDKLCYNTGQCQEDDSGDLACDCRGTGFRGEECLEDDPCSPDVCYPGICLYDTSDPAGFVCKCNGTGLMGPMCDQDDPCSPSPCENRGLCIYDENSVDGYRCECLGTGYMGENCKIDDPCRPNPCENRGSCVPIRKLIDYGVPDGVPDGDSYICECNGTGFMGPKCKIDDPCSPSPCKQGKCERLDDDGNFLCDCSGSGYGGTYCDIKQPFKNNNNDLFNMKMKAKKGNF